MKIKHQQGATLIVVLILLTIMMFMGMALYRSADLAGLITGNVSNKQMATQIGDIGLASAESFLRGTIPAADQAGYVKTQKSTDTDGIPTGVTSGEWSTSTTANGGFTYKYLVERLCDAAATACTTVAVPKCNAVAANSCATTTYEIAQMYRVTVQIDGPKNLQTYIQALYSK